MMFSTTTIVVALLAIAPFANAHMVITKPIPFGAPNNFNLDKSGSDFPCKAVPYTSTSPNLWPVGSKQRLDLKGSATHDGGSCQISVTTDKAPTKASKWKVIYSIEGGCPPPPPTGGNFLPDNPNFVNLVTPGFEFTIPPEVPNGDLAMSWTWFNKVGQREMYMNCAPVTVTGGASDMSAFEALPDMAVANLASQGTCATTEKFDYTFENPGKYKIQAGKGPFMPLCGGPSSAGGSTNGPAQQQPANPVASPVASTVALQAAPVITSTIREVVMVTALSSPGPSSKKCTASGHHAAMPSPQASGAATPALSQTPAASAPVAVPSKAPATPVPSGGAATPVPSGGATSPAVGQACSPDGSIVCSADGKQFAVCNWGKATFQSVAQGTTCKGGKIARRADYASTLRTVSLHALLA
ncbi:hypothetical protein CC86DRAFT_389430 [Ophiobolus disseminans]|uniref:Lytic polysaccharide monooxygenase n=1 Tax=Ophiobolus disseminans TaxID=1469910 RepID=A0A6A7AJA6_9PLEO|nr:hypothetical protein CC86DRAFT_389430 [Ophiobolus disseminans]